jgi:beta-lactamase superfamily II metal-dependent hydrolase
MRQVCLAAAVLSLAAPSLAQNLEIHYINVGWGSSVLVKGPNGTTVLMEAGDTGKGTAEVVPYLQSIGLPPSAGLDYTIAGHQHCDHIGGLDEVIGAGYDVRVRNYYNGSNNASSCVTEWNAAAAATSAGAPMRASPGDEIPLGNGATLTVLASLGDIIGGASVPATNENDLSIAVLIQYGGFDYLWASDLGGGNVDTTCTGRSTTQVDVETAVVRAISPGGAWPLISSGGVDVINVNHHGSESSTNMNWMNYSRPAVAIVPTGAGQASNWFLPRIDVVDKVLRATAAACITAPPAFVVQTEEGSPTGSLTSFTGYSVGNIKVTTNGAGTFTLSADGRVNQGPNEVAAAGLPRTFLLDDAGGSDTTPPATAITSPASGATVSGVITVAASASDNVGVARVEFYRDGALAATDTTAPYQWSWNTATATNGSHTLFTRAFDAAGNMGTSASRTVTVSNPTDLDISGWRLVQANSALTYTLPAGTRIPSNGYVVIARNASKPAFEAFWRGGTPLPSNVVYINSGDTAIVINGSENYTLRNAANTLIDGTTISQSSSAGQSIQRRDPCLAASQASSWNVVGSAAGTPGTGAAAGCARGVVINEFSDATGTGNFIYEFVELHYDR